MLSDEELLKIAEERLEQAADAFTPAVQKSIAASLLVIARNSMPITVNQEVPPDFYKKHKQ